MIVGVTGGIGSGKTYVSSCFELLGIPVYISDNEAKRIMRTDPKTIRSIKKLLGDASYKNDVLDTKYIASQVFNDKDKLSALNAIVHPAVAKDFDDWYTAQKAVFVIKESAILFETQGAKYCDVVLLVSAPKEVKINRVMKRDNCSRQDVIQRMSNQWEDKVKLSLADYTIINIDKVQTKKQVQELYTRLKVEASSC